MTAVAPVPSAKAPITPYSTSWSNDHLLGAVLAFAKTEASTSRSITGLIDSPASAAGEPCVRVGFIFLINIYLDFRFFTFILFYISGSFFQFIHFP
jgi:hypothetical protein